MLEEIFRDTEQRMEAVLDSARESFKKVRTGRANPTILEDVKADYYGTPTPINQMARVSVADPTLIVVQPWDKNVLDAIEKAIQKSDLGLNPQNDGEVIRLPFPQLTEERRKELVKGLNSRTEEERIAIRNIRRDANEMIRELEGDGEISEDDCRRALDDVQDLTDDYIEKLDELLEKKKEEIMQV